MSLQDKINSAKPTTFLTDGLSPEEVKQAVDEGRKRVSGTVKLIIEIPKEVKADIDNGVIRQNIDKIYLALAHGTPLEEELHREKEQAYYLGYEDGRKQNRIEKARAKYDRNNTM